MVAIPTDLASDTVVPQVVAVNQASRAAILVELGGALQGSNWAQNHPRQNEVLTSDSVLYNQINSSYGNLDGRYNKLANRAVAIQNEDLADAAANGGYITTDQQAQMDQQVNALGKAMDKSIKQSSIDSGF